MAKIYAPNPQYTGVSASVKFENGVGETSDPRLINWFKAKGYRVEEEKKDAKPKSEPKPEAKPATKARTQNTSQKRKSNKQAQ